MSHSNNDDDDNNEKISGLLLTKIETSSLDEIEFPIYNINDLTDNELNILIQNFFENDDCKNIVDIDQSKFFNVIGICAFDFECKPYRASLFGEKNGFKNIIIKFFNFLKNIMVEAFCYTSRYFEGDGDNDDNIIHLIGNIIKNSNIIERVSLPGFYLKNNALEILYIYIRDHINLKRLYFDHFPKQKMSNKYIKHLNDIIKCSNIEIINGLHNDDNKYFFENLLNNFFCSKNPNLDIRIEYINDYYLSKLSNMIIDKNINYLKEINFEFNKITTNGFSNFIGSLLKSNNRDIVKINMKYCDLGDDCIEDLGKLIKQNENIFEISLSGNNITNKGVEKLSEYIIGNIFITSIKLSHNVGITDNSLNMIKYMINSSTIIYFNIDGTNISEEFKLEIYASLRIPIEKREIPLITNFDVKSASKRIKE